MNLLLLIILPVLTVLAILLVPRANLSKWIALFGSVGQAVVFISIPACSIIIKSANRK
jgi:hypothetical protein